MPNPFHYRTVINRYAQLASDPHPPHVQVAAASALAHELMPGTQRARLAQQMLNEANPYEYARHKLRDLYDRADPAILLPTESTDAITLQDEESPEEDTDPL